MVLVGFTPPEVTKMLPSTMKRFFTSWLRPQEFTTEVSASSPMRAVPSRCQPAKRAGPPPVTSIAPAASIASVARATPWSSIRRLFSLSV